MQIQHFQSFRNLKKCSQKHGLISKILNKIIFKRHMVNQKLSYSFGFSSYYLEQST